MPLALVSLVVLAAPLAAQSTTLAGVASDGTLANDEARFPALSADGRHVAFEAKATNLCADDSNGARDVFVHDRATGTTTLVSASLSGVSGNGESAVVCLSGDGRYVAFESTASDLVAGDTNGKRDVFVRDVQLDITTRVSVSNAGTQGDGESRDPTISADGRLIAFSSTSTNLVAGDTNEVEDVFVHDLLTGETWRASIGNQGQQGASDSILPALSADGSHLGFESASQFGTGPSGFYLVDLTTGELTVSYAPGVLLSLSADARYALMGGAPGGLVVYDLLTGQSEQAGVNSQGEPPTTGVFYPTMSSDGRKVAFMTHSFDMGYGNLVDNIYLRDLDAQTTELVSMSTAGEIANSFTSMPSFGRDGRALAFASLATNLVPNATPDNFWKVFVRDLEGCLPAIATYCTASDTSTGCSAAIAATGSPGLSAAQSFEVAATSVPGGVLGVACVGVFGPDATPIGTQGGLVCVGSFARSAPLLAGGTAGACDGELRLSLADLVATEPAIAEPSGMVWVQFWFRDPGSADGFGLSDALWFQTCP